MGLEIKIKGPGAGPGITSEIPPNLFDKSISEVINYILQQNEKGPNGAITSAIRRQMGGENGYSVLAPKKGGEYPLTKADTLRRVFENNIPEDGRQTWVVSREEIGGN